MEKTPYINIVCALLARCINSACVYNFEFRNEFGKVGLFQNASWSLRYQNHTPHYFCRH